MTTTASSLSVCKLRVLAPACLAACLRLPAQHAALLGPPRLPSVLLDMLVGHELLAEAARLFAYALPEREAVWWACMCCAHTAPAELAAAEQTALDAAARWVRRPDEVTRGDAARAARARAPRPPGFWTARAAAWAAPVEAPAAAMINPSDRPGMCARAVEAAVTAASLRDAPRRRRVRLARFIASGREIAAGGAGRLPREVEQ